MSGAFRNSGPAAPRDPLPAPALRLVATPASRYSQEVRSWPSLARLERVTRIQRRSAIRVVCELEQRMLVDARPRDFAANQAGAT